MRTKKRPSKPPTKDWAALATRMEMVTYVGWNVVLLDLKSALAIRMTPEASQGAWLWDGARWANADRTRNKTLLNRITTWIEKQVADDEVIHVEKKPPIRYICPHDDLKQLSENKASLQRFIDRSLKHIIAQV